jgi:hypothetical protein
MNNSQKFVGYEFDWRDEGDENLEMGKIEELQDNNFPKGLVLLERIFDRDNTYKQKKDVSKPEDCVEINLRSKESPKLIKIGKNLSTIERRMDLVRE